MTLVPFCGSSLLGEIAKGATRAAPFIKQLFSLEGELQTKLNQPWIIGGGDASEVNTTDAAVRITEVRMVEDVEELRSEFEDLALADLRALYHGNVEVDLAWSMEHVPAQ